MPQMSPMLWLIFPIVIVMMNMMVMVVSVNVDEEVSLSFVKSLVTAIEMKVEW